LHIAQLTGATVDEAAPAPNGAAPAANGVHMNAPALGQLARYNTKGNLCPQCGNSTMYYEEGCKKCVSCGYSEC
jgi:ribonucleoside-diphosphate reductase alpha chain